MKIYEAILKEVEDANDALTKAQERQRRAIKALRNLHKKIDASRGNNESLNNVSNEIDKKLFSARVQLRPGDMIHPAIRHTKTRARADSATRAIQNSAKPPMNRATPSKLTPPTLANEG